MRTAFPEINTTIAHLRDVLGDQTYESIACEGETMTTTAMATYAYDQIDQARTELNAVSNRRHTRVSKLRVGHGTAICFTEADVGGVVRRAVGRLQEAPDRGARRRVAS
jgi:hypothetical protein